ncbi:hypothetical protein MM1S1540310_3091 [Mycobacteroides abscessus subsp. bolletii 1S-154-0310]|uniref:Uncharacterized protein n=2 Tax=Mycobacteroides abscessus TaxID=36809 RepID=A0A829QGN4_9MYCO|nr:hypothetical protein MBOL_33110 [Mycobacteroides abscessus subsp. bolletii BD]EIT91534.1 hypothetical protein MA4S0726RB_2864 [Mycobacteroides abscessus 4S-0726-RB]EIU06204.1 hypothetical protein MA5S0421_3116 [Mycobacteroides abscessus 5S-0421]EIU25351.1 hypothetical protein MA5S0817_2407 [Mycobacteroides abscessus 5S-0817]EIU38856.1 hypothetical protein MA6G0125R_2612 [Mycobacteroides abscessus 6G-0125-R]EIU63194.1 hypothetical protein MM1S1510930_3534 [Mycobacteroides abscessus subsp. bo
MVGTRIGPAVWADTTTQTKAGGGVGDGAGTRGGVTWSHDIDHQIAYITVACKRPAK